MKTKDINFWSIISPILIISTTLIVILFSRGWRIDLEEKTVVSTGVLNITSEPRSAVIYIDGEKKGKTPSVIDSILPGEHTVELVKEGYTSWKKTIDVKKEYVTGINASLFESSIEITEINNQPYQFIEFSKENDQALVIRNEENAGIWKLQFSNGFLNLGKSEIKIANLAEENLFDLSSSKYSFTINSNFTKAILKTETIIDNESKFKYFLLDLDRETSDIKDITSTLLLSSNYYWSKDNLHVLAEYDNSLTSLNTNNLQQFVILNFRPQLYTTTESNIYFLEEDSFENISQLYSISNEGLNKKEIITPDNFALNFLNSLFVNEELKVIILSNESESVYFEFENNYSQIITENCVNIINSSPDNRYILLSNKTTEDLLVYDIEEEKISNFKLEISVDANELFWSPDSNNLFFRYTDENRNNIIGSMAYDGTNYYEILKRENYQGTFYKSIGFSKDSKNLYVSLVSDIETTQEENEDEENTVLSENIYEITLR